MKQTVFLPGFLGPYNTALWYNSMARVQFREDIAASPPSFLYLRETQEH